MRQVAGSLLAIIVAAFGVGGSAASAAGTSSAEARAVLAQRMDRLEAEITAAEDLRAIRKLQRAYGYYLDKGMWEDLAAFFTEDAVANYPAGVFVGHESIRRHLFMNVGAGKLGDIGLGDNRLYDHLNIQPVVHLDAGGLTAKGRWRAFAMFGSFGGAATWAEGVYEVQYAKVAGVWKISKLDYYSGFGAPYATGWVAPDTSAPSVSQAATSIATSGAAGVKGVTPAVSTAAKEGGSLAAAVASGVVSSARPRRVLAHPADRERNMECDGFPAACIAPFHYENPGTPAGGNVWDGASLLANISAAGRDVGKGNSNSTGNSTGNSNSNSNASKSNIDPRQRAADLAHRATLLNDEQQIENLQRIYGYYLDRAMWNQVADLFASDATIELAQQGVYVGKPHIRAFLGTLGHHGLTEGWLNDHIQLQSIVDVAPDGNTARARSRELAMTGHYQGQGTWSEGVYENRFVKQKGIWKIQALHFYPTFITDYDKGWAKDAQPAPTASTQLPPDRLPTEVYEIYPKAHVPPFHYRNPVTGEAPHYPKVGGPSPQLAAAALEPILAPAVNLPVGAAGNRAHLSAVEPAPRSALVSNQKNTFPAARRLRSLKDVNPSLNETELTVSRVKDVHALDNLQSAYGYYLDKNLWNNLADLFARDGSMELAQRGVYQGQDHVRAFLVQVFGRGQEGPVAGRLGNHIQMQPVIHVSPDGQTAKIRVRMLQQLNMGSRASMGGSVYENEAVKENGVWKFKVVHTYNTFAANYEGGWTRTANRGVPGPSKELPPDAPPTLVFEMFPAVYDIPFHYANPVTGRNNEMGR